MVPVNVVVGAVVLALVTLSAAICGVACYRLGAKSVQAEWDAERVQFADAQAQQRAAAQDRERQLQANLNRLKKEKTYETTRVAAIQRDLADSLSHRADRAGDGGLPPTAGDRDAAPSCTGAQLFRSDGEFLAREAARADELRLHLSQCQAAYSAALSDSSSSCGDSSSACGE